MSCLLISHDAGAHNIENSIRIRSTEETQMITIYGQMRTDIDALHAFLAELNIDAALKSHLEHDYLIAMDFIEKYDTGRHDEQTEEGRAALGGLHELYKWIWSIKNSQEFGKLIPHLK